MSERMLVTFQRDEDSDNYPFISLLRNNKMRMFLFDELLFEALGNDGLGVREPNTVSLTDYFVPDKTEVGHFCQLKSLEMPSGQRFSLLPISDNELDPFCVGLISCDEMDASEIIRILDSKMPYLNHYYNNNLWKYEARYGESSSEVGNGFFSMEDAIDHFFRSEHIQDFTIICNGQDYTAFFHRQARQAELKKSLSEYLPSRVVNEIFYSMSVDDFDKMTKERTENKENSKETLRSMRR